MSPPVKFREGGKPVCPLNAAFGRDSGLGTLTGVDVVSTMFGVSVGAFAWQLKGGDDDNRMI